MKHLLLAIASVSLVACSSSSPRSASNGIVAAPAGDGDAIVGAIADPSLAKGECGMILWTLEANQPAPVFKLTSGKSAEMVVNGKAVKFAITGTGGAAGFGVFEEQELSADGYTASVKVRFGLGFDGGSYLERGLVSVESPSGWRAVIPAAGVAGCRSR